MTITGNRWVLAALVGVLLAAAVAAQTPEFHPMVIGHRIVRLQAVDGMVYIGLKQGGVVQWDSATQTVVRHLTRGDGLGGHVVQDLAWSGSRLLIATKDGGLTAIADPGGSDEFIEVYSFGLSSLDITCAVGQQVASGERIYYGTRDRGVGVIEARDLGASYTIDDGMIDDAIIDLALVGDVLLIATEEGISRFENNVFENVPYDDGFMVNDLEIAADGTIMAATTAGIQKWNDEERVWELVDGAVTFLRLAVDGLGMVGLTNGNTVYRIDADGFSQITTPDEPDDERLYVDAAVSVDDRLWVGGMIRLQEHVGASLAGRPWLAEAGAADAMLHEFDTCQIGGRDSEASDSEGFSGVAVDSRGRAWAGNSQGDGLVMFDGEHWENYVRKDSEDEGFDGFFNYGSGMLALARSGDAIWFGSYTMGAGRFVPPTVPGDAGEWMLLQPENSAMQVDGVIAIATHPDGAILFCSDAAPYFGSPNHELGVDILLDPENPEEEASWTHLYPRDLDAGNVVLTAYVERRDVVWFAVENKGLKRWDINGLDAGPDAEITWADHTDDHWSESFAHTDQGSLELTSVRAIVADDEGVLWAGGSGLTRFVFTPNAPELTELQSWSVNTGGGLGLLDQAVTGLAVDRNQDVWALSGRGLDRVHIGADGIEIDAFTDLESWGEVNDFYSYEHVAALPGQFYRQMDVSADGTSIVVSSTSGGVLVTIPERVENPSHEITAHLYPNPFTGEGGNGLVNLDEIVVDQQNPARLEILNVAGQVVYRNSDLVSMAIWDGRNRLGERVASGLYLVRLEQGGQVKVMTLAVVF